MVPISPFSALLVFAGLIAVNGQSTGIETCKPPEHRVVRDFSSLDGRLGSLQISIRPADMSIPQLLCLGRYLRQAHPAWDRATVALFASDAEARDFVALSDRRTNETLRAMVTVEGSESHLTIFPIGLWHRAGEGLTSEFDLNATSRTCRLRLQDRCVLSIPTPIFPPKVLLQQGAGEVTLSARVLPDGHLDSVRVVAVSASSNMAMLLRDQAMREVRMWRVEPAGSTETAQVTLAYEIEPNPAPNTKALQQGGGEISFRLEPPARLVILGTPPK